jgi:hypothetical protein
MNRVQTIALLSFFELAQEGSKKQMLQEEV